MKSAKILILLVLLLFITTLCFQQPIEAQEAKVRKVSAETVDSIVFEVSVSKTTFDYGENIPLNYIVTNKGDKPVFLVIDPNFINIQPRETFIIYIVQPVTGPDDHLPFNFEFIKILPKKSYKGNLVIKNLEELKSMAKYTFETAEIQVGFSYIFDVSNFSGCKTASYRLPCLNELYENSKSLTIGNLLIENKQK